MPKVETLPRLVPPSGMGTEQLGSHRRTHKPFFDKQILLYLDTTESVFAAIEKPCQKNQKT